MERTAWSWATRSLFLLVCLVWGFNFLFIRVGLASATPLWLALLRASVGTAATALVLIPLGAWNRLDGRGRRDALLLGLPNTTAFYALLFVGIQSILPGIAAVLTYTFPLWVALLSPLVLSHRLGPLHWLSVAVGFAGVAVISQPWQTGVPSLSLLPILEVLGAAVGWATGTVLFQRRFVRSEMLEANAFQLIGGSLGLAVLVVVLGPTPLPTPSPQLGASLLWLGVLGTALAYSIWFDLLGRTRAATLSAYAFLVPVVALVGSVIFFGERLSLAQLGGVALVLASIYGIGRVTPEGQRTPPLLGVER